MRWRLLLALLGVMGVMLVAQDVPLAPYLRHAEHDRQLADLERDAFILAGQAAVVLRPEEGAAASPDALAIDALADTAAGYATREGRDVTIVDEAGVVVVAATGADDDLDDAVALGSAAVVRPTWRPPSTAKPPPE
ncbi:hypothetical protein BH24ACT5_BH24ACT5_08800 [soil metagenome]